MSDEPLPEIKKAKGTGGAMAFINKAEAEGGEA
jgi:hypothetical protein